MSQYDIGIFGLWYGHNYGSILTYYALSQVFERNGRSIAMIENPLNAEPDLPHLRRSHPIRFARKHYEITPQLGLDRMHELNRLFDTFVIGSDQMWNYGLSRPYRLSYYLNFAAEDKPRYSCAVSFGQEQYQAPAPEMDAIREELRRFSGISVRDDFSQRILKDVFGVESELMTDPVFLCPKESFDGLIGEVENLAFAPKRDYFFAYVLDPDPVTGDALCRLADETDMPVYVCFNESGDKQRFCDELRLHSEKVTCFDDPTAQEWLYLLSHAKGVLTDSFHGACFSMIYNKPFVVKKNMRRGGRRFDFLLDSFGLKDRMIENSYFFCKKMMSTDLNAGVSYQLRNRLTESSSRFISNI